MNDRLYVTPPKLTFVRPAAFVEMGSKPSCGGAARGFRPGPTVSVSMDGRYQPKADIADRR